jgi:hypothetical protein
MLNVIHANIQLGNAKTQTHDVILDSNKTQRYSKITRAVRSNLMSCVSPKNTRASC